MAKKKTVGKKVSLPVVDVSVEKLKPAPWNPRQISDHDFENLQRLISEFGMLQPIVVQKNGTVIGGHQRLKVAKALGMKKVPVTYVDFPDERAKALNIGFNRTAGDWDEELLERLYLELKEYDDPELLTLTGLTNEEMDLIDQQAKDAAEEAEGGGGGGLTLAERFVVPPFTVLDGRQGYWRDRKREWLSLGIRSLEGRDWNVMTDGGVAAMEVDRRNRSKRRKPAVGVAGTAYSLQGLALPKGSAQSLPDYAGASILDPVLIEVLYRWFSRPHARTLDVFAGGTGTGVVGAALGRRYVGVEIRPTQVKANRAQWKRIRQDVEKSPWPRGHRVTAPTWVLGNSLNLSKIVKGKFDFVISHPPYYDLEKYSTVAGDLSSYRNYEMFLRDYRKIIANAVGVLRPNSFAAIVVGDVRDKNGALRGLPAATVKAFADAGAVLYNAAFYITPLTTLPIRTSAQFHRRRKLGKGHQDVLVFWKGAAKDVPALPTLFTDDDLREVVVTDEVGE